MPYTISQIKVLAYNRKEQSDFSDADGILFRGLRYCYDCHRAGYDKEDIEPILNGFLRYYDFLTAQDKDEGK